MCSILWFSWKLHQSKWVSLWCRLGRNTLFTRFHIYSYASDNTQCTTVTSTNILLEPFVPVLSELANIVQSDFRGVCGKFMYISCMCGIHTTAICYPPDGCRNDGYCVFPGQCSCRNGWRGAKCDEGITISYSILFEMSKNALSQCSNMLEWLPPARRLLSTKCVLLWATVDWPFLFSRCVHNYD